jgi:glyoxylase-like metal-dependent hydrolase (beta-lactamase superfamily II)/ferredoxin
VARAALRRPENVPGRFFVDATCIDCDTCRWMAPGTFARRNGKSAVVAQPAGPRESDAALLALVACPTASIGAEGQRGVAEAAQAFPVLIADGVRHCGYHSRASFGATSYLIERPEGNVMVDTPRFAGPLAERIEALGGLSHILLTHRDDVADHDKWARRFGAQRVLHAAEGPIPDGPVERLLEGDAPQEVVPGLTAVPTPGHTRGHVVYHWQGPGDSFLFTGDHLAYDDEAGRLEAWPDVCWYDWGEQTASMRRLRDWPADWVLPGHGRRVRVGRAAMPGAIDRLVAWMESR